LTDPDFVTFLREAHKSLKPGGYLCFKENTTSKKSGDFIIDKEDSSVCRSDAHYQNLFSQVQDLFQLVAQQEQQWKGLLPVKMYALVKK
jgi:protein N-terminal methyltransferase